MKISNEEKAMWLEDWKQSGKKAWTYAKENGLIPQTFCSWVKQKSKKKTDFVEVPKRRIKQTPELLQEIIIEKGDIKIHIPLSVWAEGSEIILEGLRTVL